MVPGRLTRTMCKHHKIDPNRIDIRKRPTIWLLPASENRVPGSSLKVVSLKKRYSSHELCAEREGLRHPVLAGVEISAQGASLIDLLLHPHTDQNDAHRR